MTMPAPLIPPSLPAYPPAAVAPPPVAAPAPAMAPAPYAQPGFLPAAAPQGYPGPAVPLQAPAPVASAPAVAQPVQQPQPGQPYPAYAQPAPAPTAPQPLQVQAAPAPMGYGQPQAAAMPPQYAAPNPYAQQQPQGYAPNPYAQPMQPAAVDIGSAIAEATGGDRNPVPDWGDFVLEVIDTIATLHPAKRTLTLKANFKVHASNNPSHPVGSEVAYIEGLTWGGGRAQEFILTTMGFPHKQHFDQAVLAAGRLPQAELKLLGNAVGNPTTQDPGNHYPPNPLKGRFVHAVVSQRTGTYGPNSPKRGQPKQWTNWDWSLPAAGPAT